MEKCLECGQIKTHQNHWAPFGWHNFVPSDDGSIPSGATNFTGFDDVEEQESQSSKHCDEGYMNDTRFGDSPDY